MNGYINREICFYKRCNQKDKFCICQTLKGKRCKSYCYKDYEFCKIHFRIIIKKYVARKLYNKYFNKCRNFNYPLEKLYNNKYYKIYWSVHIIENFIIKYGQAYINRIHNAVSKIRYKYRKHISTKCFLDCSICTDEILFNDINPYNNLGNCIILECKHKYHIDCFMNWYIRQKFCPYCKKNIESNAVIELSFKCKYDYITSIKEGYLISYINIPIQLVNTVLSKKFIPLSKKIIKLTKSKPNDRICDPYTPLLYYDIVTHDTYPYSSHNKIDLYNKVEDIYKDLSYNQKMLFTIIWNHYEYIMSDIDKSDIIKLITNVKIGNLYLKDNVNKNNQYNTYFTPFKRENNGGFRSISIPTLESLTKL